MVHLYRYIILIISLCTTQLVSAYGLRFRGAASPIDERTSYDVFAHSCPSFKDYFDLSSTWLCILPRVSAMYCGLRELTKDRFSIFL